MSWMENLSKEEFQSLVREAVRPDLEELRKRINELDGRIARVEASQDGYMRAYKTTLETVRIELKGELERLFRSFQRDLLDEPKSRIAELEGAFEALQRILDKGTPR